MVFSSFFFFISMSIFFCLISRLPDFDSWLGFYRVKVLLAGLLSTLTWLYMEVSCCAVSYGQIPSFSIRNCCCCGGGALVVDRPTFRSVRVSFFGPSWCVCLDGLGTEHSKCNIQLTTLTICALSTVDSDRSGPIHRFNAIWTKRKYGPPSYKQGGKKKLAQ